MTGNGMMPGGGRGGASSGAVAPPRGGKFRRAPAPAGPAAPLQFRRPAAIIPSSMDRGLPDSTARPQPPLDPRRLRVFPLAQRESLARIEAVLVDPAAPPPPVSAALSAEIRLCAELLRQARARAASRILMYGAHLVRNGAGPIIERLLAEGWLTHLATNGAGTIHDWEFAFLGRSTESVERNVAAGTFGAWEETGRSIHIALMAGALRGEGWGAALGRFIEEDGAELPAPEELEAALRREPSHPLAPARAELLGAMRAHGLRAGREEVRHPWKRTSLLAAAFRLGAPVTVHPGIGYDIITNHPMFNGAVLGRAGGIDAARFGGVVEGLDGGVVISVGSAVMAPQVFEKSLSAFNNLRIAAGRPIVGGHAIFVVDLQDGGRWDWRRGEPPKDNPAYYLRFCKSFARMGGLMRYLQCDNLAFAQNLLAALEGRAVAEAAP